MSENCTHNCNTCGENCSSRQKEDLLVPLNNKSSVKKVIGVSSGKGGVGKSSVTSLLAVLLSRKGYKCAILDADITGPSIPTAFGVSGLPDGSEGAMLPKISKGGIKIISTNLLLEDEKTPVIWRGPVIAGIVKQFWTDVLWGDIDFMFIDMPPGTGDVPLTVFQSVPINGTVIVSTPQSLVSMVVEKAINMAEKMDIPVLGIVENMSYIKCPDCGKKIEIFGKSNIENLCFDHGIKLLSRMPFDSKLSSLVDNGNIESFNEDYLSAAANEIEALLN